MSTSVLPQRPSLNPTSAEAAVVGYAPKQNAYDELLQPDGSLREHWSRFAQALSTLGPEELSRRWDAAQRQLRENGVTYNVYDDSRGMDRPWQLEPVPLLVSASEWRTLERGLAQRAYLLNLILDDVYNQRSLIRQRILPGELVFRNPGFLRPCHGTIVRGGRWLHLYAADLARDPSGAFWVLGDRAQAPSGMGYALENRIVLSRVFPSLYRDCRVERLAGFFRKLLDLVQRLSPRANDRPLAVVLSPGPYNETYFEHAYLARYLGLTLVEGGDLTVRNNTVYMKTLSGLARVDVVVRRTDDSFCDPLALRADSSLGIAGLVSAVRAGNVSVLNALGSGVVEAPALLAYLPSVCRHLLGEDLILPSAPVTWCASPGAMQLIQDRFEHLVFKPAFPRPGGPEPVFGGAMSQADHAALLDRVRARPHEWVAQERVPLSSAPIWNGDGLEPREIAVRCYAVGDGPGYSVMPGGLTRVARPGGGDAVVSMQRGAGSKDTWVLTEDPVSPLSLLGRREERLLLSRSGNDLPSRVADNLYWLGRYLERAEGSARLLRRVLARLLDDTHSAEPSVLHAMFASLSTQYELSEPLTWHPGMDVAAVERDVVGFLRSGSHGTGLLPSLAGMHRTASVVRDRISRDTWHVLSQLARQREALMSAGSLSADEALEALDGLILLFGAFAGLQNENLSRTYGYRFTDMGRRLERARYTSTLLYSMVGVVHPDEASVLSELLEVLDNGITYRRRYQDVMQAAPTLDLVLTDESNPRSIAFQLVALHDHVRALPRSVDDPLRTREERVALAAVTSVRLVDVEALCEVNAQAERPLLQAHLQELGRHLPAMSDAITESYLVHAVPRRAFGSEG
ncbi:MAG TPA: circularly permuted type 2 ATP-grasp protein [Polyangiales bacterium]|nr:circularly permuted type 2 ATP-grasp protein [Polyangiales bacterium]